jgi:cyclic pyranopterin phosphate synthase
MSMIDISKKKETKRTATAYGRIKLKEETIKLIKNKQIEKGDVFEIAKVAGMLAVKKTPETIPHCHQIPITSINIDFEISGNYVDVFVKVKTVAKTGVEIDALCGVSTALLTLWDVVKKYEKDENGQYPDTKISEIKIIEKIKGEQ